MAKVFLRVYNHEIESMIEGGQLDEAVAHCQHILKTFPMHVDTYRLLGKAFQEARRYGDAADIFQRVLMAVPDDFVSHVGMSIIRDDENKLDDAIWHMERAFEVQPSNSAIQGELRRLYGRRDGVEPSKIRLSRDALANMYSQGELFNQAIAEIRSVLAEDTNRPDLQVMLARAYYRSDHKVEAAEMAAALLKKYPYNLDSLRVLVDVLPGTAREENTQVYRQRLNNLDPYSAFAVNSAFASDQVADSAVNLERLDYKAGPVAFPSQPEWASSLGIKLQDEVHIENPPEWMQSEETPEQVPPSSVEPPAPQVEQVPPANVENVPDWMRSAGWQESTNAAEVEPTDSGEPLPDETIAKADIPDWLQSMAPTEVPEQATSESDNSVESLPIGVDGIPVWLKPTNSVEDIGMTNENKQPSESQPAGGSEASEPVKPVVPEAPVGRINPDILPQPEESKTEPVETQPVKPPDLPDWLKSMAADEPIGEGQADSSVQPGEPPEKPAEIQPEKPDELPDWLKSLAPTQSSGKGAPDSLPPAFADQPSDEFQPSSEGDVPEWLKSMDLPKDIPVPQAGTSQQPLQPQPAPIERPTSEAGAIPDWFKTLENANPVQAAPSEAASAPEGNYPMGAEIPSVMANASTPVESSGDIKIEPPAAEVPAAKTELNPDWMNTVGSRADAAALAAKPVEQPAAVQPIPETPGPSGMPPRMPENAIVTPAAIDAESIPPAEEVKPLIIDDDAFSWLESLAAKQGASPDELLTNPEQRSERIPDWLSQQQEQPAPESNLHVEQATAAAGGISPISTENPLSPPPAEPPAQPADQIANGADDTMVWLEKMDLNQAVEPEKGSTAPVAETGIPPEQIKSGPEKASAAEVEMKPITPPQAPSEDDMTITTWLSKQDVKEALEKKAGEKRAEAATSSSDNELPDWLKNLEKPNASPEAPKSENELPEWLRYSKSAEVPETTSPAPVVDSSQETDLPAWLGEEIPGQKRAVPTMPEEWQPAETAVSGESVNLPQEKPIPAPEMPTLIISNKPPIPAPSPSGVAKPEMNVAPGGEAIPPGASIPIPVRPAGRMPTLKQTGMLSHIPVQDKDSELLASAQDVLDQNSLDDAMKQYSKLVKKGRLLDEVIHDLREAIYRYPVDVIIWQTLGDAYMRTNRLQDALDAYTKAEELLR